MTDERTTMISPAVAGYFRIPPVWIGERPSENEIRQMPESNLIRDVYRETLSNGIDVRVRRDGIFIFDFTNCALAGPTTIPDHPRSPGQRIPSEVVEAETLAESRLAYRTQIMNVHQACLSTSETIVHKRSSELGKIINPYQTIRPITADDNNFLRTDTNNPTSYYINLQISYLRNRNHKILSRRSFIELNTLEFSFKLLEKIMNNNTENILDIFYMLYKAAHDYAEHRFSESLTMSWTACESMLNIMWLNFIIGQKYDQNGTVRINKDRQKKAKRTRFHCIYNFRNA